METYLEVKKMFTKQHYKAIAEIVKRRVDTSTSCLISPAMLSKELADYFAKDNPNFDRDKFLAACGIE
jgi:stalled ribosome rescue protein Dom34